MDESRATKGAMDLFISIKNRGPCTKQDLVEETRLSERTIRTYLEYLIKGNLVKEVPNYGKIKKYASIDWVPVYDENKPLAQRWVVFSPATHQRHTLGELATYYGQNVPSASLKAAEFLFKAPALFVYYAQENELSEEEKNSQLLSLQEVLKEAVEQLQSAMSVLQAMIHDPRLWRSDLLDMFRISPDYVLPSELTKIIERLREESEETTEES